jgi:glycosyltransferase involved in cell wall biosynthesis
MPDLWHLVLVGDGPERGQLERLVEGSGLTRRIHFTGQVSDPETYLQLADVYVLSSEKEAFGQVLIEAMACGLPVAAFDPELPGVATATNEIVPEEWLFKAKQKDAAALSAAIAGAVEAGCDPKRIAQWARERYSWAGLASDLIRLGSAFGDSNE